MANLELGARLSQDRILEKTGEGGMDQVYRAWDVRLERPLAIKRIGGRLLHEARIVSALNHPNVCIIHEANENGEAAYIVMEFVEGQTLGAIIPKGGLPIATLLRYATRIADAVVEGSVLRSGDQVRLTAQLVRTATDERLTALELNPGYPTGHHFYAFLHMALGRTSNAASKLERAESLDPLAKIIAAAHGWVLCFAHGLDRAIAPFKKALDRLDKAFDGRCNLLCYLSGDPPFEALLRRIGPAFAT